MNEYETYRQFHVPEDERRFVDMTHDAQGRMCRVYFYPKTAEYVYEPIKGEGRC